jgi:hypothetical protein
MATIEYKQGSECGLEKRKCGLTSRAVVFVWLSGAEVVGSGKSRSREEGGGGVEYYISTAIQIRTVYARARKQLSDGRRVKVQVMQMVIHPYARSGMGPLSGYEGAKQAVNGRSDADVSGHCFRGGAYGRCNSI